MRVLMTLSKALRFDPRVHKEAQALQAAGHEVRVLEWGRHEPDAPAEEDLGGVHVHRVHGGPALRHGPMPARMAAWWRTGTRAATALHRTWPFDVVHAHDLDTLPIGARLKRRFGVPLVFDAHEIYAGIVAGRVAARAADRLERRLLRQVDRIVTCSDAFADHYRTWDPRITVVWNAFADAPWSPEATGNDAFTVGYIGTLTRDRFFPQAVKALGGMDGVVLDIVGKHEGTFTETQAAATRFGNVRFSGPIPHEEVLARTRAHDAVLCFQDPGTPQYRIQLTNKTFDAMACGRPLIAAAGTAVGHFVEEHAIGATGPYTAEGLRDCVARLRDDPDGCRRMGKVGGELARRRFHWGPQADALRALYASLG